MDDNKPSPTAAELEILNILWEKEPLTVKDVHDKLSLHKDIGYTTALKIMQNMTSKGLLNREPNGKNHLYYTACKKEETTPNNTAGNFAATEPEAFICGIVQAAKVFENPLTHYYFQWARVKVQGAFFDVCVDTSILDSPMTPGGVVAGNFNISGLIVV